MTWWALGVSVVSAAVSAYGQYQQGQAAKATANANAALQERNARYQLMVSRLSEKVAQRQAEFERQVSDMQAQASFNNAQQARNEAEAIAAQNEENAARQRKAAEEALARNRGVYAAAGLVDTTGTPLAMLADQAMLEESAVADSHYLANVERGKKLFEAQAYDLEGKTKSFEGQANSAIAKQASYVRGLTAQVNHSISMKQADINRRSGSSAASAATIGAISSFVGSTASAYGSARSTKMQQDQIKATTGG